MDINKFCAPALLYVAFSLTQIIIDTFKHMYNTALVKVIIMIIFTFILNILCQRGLGIISWFIVFIPFITMTVITAILLISFGLHPSTGKKEYTNVPKKNRHYSRENIHKQKDKQKNKKCNK